MPCGLHRIGPDGSSGFIFRFRYTFPTEAKFADLDFARTVHDHAVRAHLRHGTTTCCYFASIHVPASLQLCDTVSAYGQRALIGKVRDFLLL